MGRSCHGWPERPRAYVDIGPTLDVKVAALRAHESQHRTPDQLEGMMAFLEKRRPRFNGGSE